MKKLLSLLSCGAVFSIMAFGENWSGRLIDASCYDQQKKTATCDATTATSSFALDVAGKVYKLDAAGNTKAGTAIRSRADRAADPNNPQSMQMTAKVTGVEKGGVITVETVDVQ